MWFKSSINDSALICSFLLNQNKNIACVLKFAIITFFFSGEWTQILGVFSSRGNVKAHLLSKLLLEATILAEKSGLRVDFWTGAGAPWNRRLWKLLGIKGKLPHSIHFHETIHVLLACIRLYNFFLLQHHQWRSHAGLPNLLTQQDIFT